MGDRSINENRLTNEPEKGCCIPDLMSREWEAKQLSFALKHVKELVFLVDEDGYFKFVNDEACRVLGYTREELLYGMGVPDISTNMTKENWKEHWQHIKSCSAITFEGSQRNKYGRVLPVEINANYFEFDGQCFTMGLVRDISERKRLEENLVAREQESRTLIENSPDTIARYDNKCHRIYVNPAFAAAVDGGIEKLLGKKPSEYPGGLNTELYETKIKEVFATGKDAQFELKWTGKDGREFCSHIRLTAESDLSGTITSILGVGRDISELNDYRTELKRAWELLKSNAQLLRESQIIAGLGSYVLDIKTGWWESSDVLDSLFGIDETFERTVEGWQSLTHPDDRTMMEDYLKNEVIGLCHKFVKEYRIIRQNDKAVRWVHGLGKLEFDFQGRPIKLYGTIQDITDQKLSEHELRIAATAFEAQEGMTITDADGTILRVNSAFTNITGYSAEEAIGKNPRLLKSGRHDKAFYAAMWQSITNTGVWKGEIWNKRKDGKIYPERLSITAVKGADGIVTNYVATFTDIAEIVATVDEIKHLAFFDPLTKLPNRRLLFDRLQQAMASSARTGNENALLFIDLDNFKTLNDTLGHDIGDLLLKQVAQRLASCVRGGDTVARLGGDEFVVMLEDLNEYILGAAGQVESVGKKILESIRKPYQIGAHECFSSPSIGITLFKGLEYGLEELLKQADIAMYQAKKDGRNTLRFFDPQMQNSINVRATLERELRYAVENQQLHLYYQIQVDASHRPVGAEALIRWIHPELGLVSPAQFIPMAEETGVILPIGQWVLETACVQLQAWQKNALTRKLALAVNVSAKQFRQSDFVAKVQAAIQHHAINPMLLKLELTESLLLDNIEDTIATMNSLNNIGVRFSLDDFGTGYSSLQYLKRLPLDQLKIDQSFVRDIATDNSDKAIVSTIIAMARSLNLDVIAEGVETEEQRRFLLKNGCTHYQGYLYSKPVPIDQFEALLHKG